LRGKNVVNGWKLFTLRKDGTLGSLFINRRARIRPGKWHKSESYPTKGYKHRPYWHATDSPEAPHLTKTGRAWRRVELKGVTEMERPFSQGGLWYLADWLRVEDVNTEKSLS